MGISPVGWIFVRSWRGAKLMRELAGANTIYWTLFSKFRNSLYLCLLRNSCLAISTLGQE